MTPAQTSGNIRIKRQTYDCDQPNMLFILEDTEGNTFEKTAAEICREESLINNMRKEDIFIISYVAGMELDHSTPYNNLPL